MRAVPTARSAKIFRIGQYFLSGSRSGTEHVWIGPIIPARTRCREAEDAPMNPPEPDLKAIFCEALDRPAGARAIGVSRRSLPRRRDAPPPVGIAFEGPRRGRWISRVVGEGCGRRRATSGCTGLGHGCDARSLVRARAGAGHRRVPAGDRRATGHHDRSVQAAPEDRRRRHGRRLHGRAGKAGPPQGGAQGHQARHGHGPGHRALRGRAAGAGDHGPSQYRAGPGRRGHRHRPAVLRDGAGQGRSDHRILRPESSHAKRAAGAVHPGLPGDPTCRTKKGSSTATSSRRTCS